MFQRQGASAPQSGADKPTFAELARRSRASQGLPPTATVAQMRSLAALYLSDQERRESLSGPNDLHSLRVECSAALADGSNVDPLDE